jgi:hypothetical protein
MNSAAHLWNGTAEQALAVLRAEWSHIDASMAAVATGERPQRSPALKAALASITGSYATKLGVLLAAAPASKQSAIAEAFAQVLDVATAAKMRGVAAGSWYRFECWIDGRRQPSKQMQCDERGARELAKRAEQDALAAGAQDVRVVWSRMESVGRRAA